MHSALIILNIALFAIVLLLAFLVVGALRALGLLTWRIEQIEVTSPRRIGRDGLVLGKHAPDFTLPSAVNGEISLHDFAGRQRLIVFTQSGCGPCHSIMPELNRVQAEGDHQVLVVNNGTLEETRAWAAELGARFPVLTQQKWEISKRYEVFATPFAFVVDQNGIVKFKGLVGTRQYLGYVLSGSGQRGEHHDDEHRNNSVAERDPESSLTAKELSHV